LFSSQFLTAQTSYPLQGQIQGGDRRGIYVSDEDAQRVYDETEEIPRLYADPKTYIHNMTVLGHVPGHFRNIGMMTVGGNRYIFGGGMAVDVTNPRQPVVVNRRAPGAEIAYNQKLQKWILIQAHQCCSIELDVVQGRKPFQTAPPPGTKVGVTFYDATDPRNLVELSHFSTGPGSFGTRYDGNYYDGGRYAYLSSKLPGTRGQPPFEATDPILQILDLSDIRNPKEASRWWVPGQMKGEEEEFRKWPEAGRFLKQASEPWSPSWRNMYLYFHGPCIVPKRVEDGGNRGYCSFSALGMRVLDFTDIRQPKLVSTVDISPPFDGGFPVHTVYPIPERRLAFISGETTRPDCQEGLSIPWVVDMRDERHPMTIAAFPIPKPPAEAPYTDFCFRGGRVGTHAPQEFKAPGKQRIDLMGYAFYDAGFRLFDISNPFRPEEVAWIVPPAGPGRGTEGAIIEWDRNVIHAATDTGLYILSTPVLGEPVLGPLKPERWNVEGLNAGAP
jgi:hypothetical protein